MIKQKGFSTFSIGFSGDKELIKYNSVKSPVESRSIKYWSQDPSLENYMYAITIIFRGKKQQLYMYIGWEKMLEGSGDKLKIRGRGGMASATILIGYSSWYLNIT